MSDKSVLGEPGLISKEELHRVTREGQALGCIESAGHSIDLASTYLGEIIDKEEPGLYRACALQIDAHIASAKEAISEAEKGISRITKRRIEDLITELEVSCE